jgi:hypothetical protein
MLRPQELSPGDQYRQIINEALRIYGKYGLAVAGPRADCGTAGQADTVRGGNCGWNDND